MKADVLSALAEPNRLKIVELLRDGPLSVNEVASRLHLRQPQVSKHLQTLQQAGIVSVHPDAQRRVYAIRSKPFTELETWLGEFERHANRQLDKLEDYLNNEKEKEDGKNR